ncbi:MAG: TolC family protein [Marinilabiliaceae bacterium]|nr:TolC family protein [Marinilabiliaceae bacterium]
MKFKYLITLAIGILLGICTFAQQRQITLDLQRVIAMASDSSLTAFRNKNMYLASYWTYRSYKAERLPSLALNLTPANYYRSLVSRYDSYSDMDVYRSQRSYSASGALSLSQNFDPLGGTFYVETSLDYLRYFGATTSTQFSAVPVIIGYRHSMFGYNEFKWDKKIEPMKFEKAKLEYLYNTESLASLAVSYFFSLAQAQSQYELAKEQAASCDSLLVIGERKYKLAAITKSDLLSLRLDVVNARNAISSAEVDMERASLALTSFLGIDRNSEIHIVLPGTPTPLSIDAKLALEMMHKNSYMILEKMQNVSEAERQLDMVKKSTRFNASVNASVGFNQQAEKIGDAYSNPTRKDIVSLSFTIPILDWGVGRGMRNNATNNLNVAKIDAQQKIMELEQDVIVTIDELRSRYNLIASAEEALILAEQVYKENKIRFSNGTCDITTLSQSQQRLLNAQNGYIDSMRNYWVCYYDLRKQTLYDFQMNISLSDIFDFNNLQ